jgi:hypothetical protein
VSGIILCFYINLFVYSITMYYYYMYCIALYSISSAVFITPFGGAEDTSLI